MRSSNPYFILIFPMLEKYFSNCPKFETDGNLCEAFEFGFCFQCRYYAARACLSVPHRRSASILFLLLRTPPLTPGPASPRSRASVAPSHARPTTLPYSPARPHHEHALPPLIAPPGATPIAWSRCRPRASPSPTASLHVAPRETGHPSLSLPAA
jgi:hypothetical protein